MCGRFGVTKPPWDLVKRLQGNIGTQPEFKPRYNIAPTQPVLSVINDEERSLIDLRWGLVPAWAQNPAALKLSTFNARVETIATAPNYRKATRSRRCIIAADGFYEWRKNADGSKTPLWIHRTDGAPFAFAGLWDVWRSSDQRMASCTIITAPANEFMEQTHSRMPIVLDDVRALEWLQPKPLEARDALDILMPSADAREWEMYAVSARVGNVRNDDAFFVAPL